MDNLLKLFETVDTNIPEQDGAKCQACGEQIPIKYKSITRTDANGKILVDTKGVPVKRKMIDRSNRIDCDAARGENSGINQSYHKDCWKRMVYGYEK
jgi:hypothetical protein